MNEGKPAAVLIFGYGNPGRGDDALGPLFIEELERQLSPAVCQSAGGIEFLTDFQLQVEHTLDLQGRALVLFVDAHVSCHPPFELSGLKAAERPSYSTHALEPAAVLHWFSKIYGDLRPPPCFILGIRGESFELGDPLSPEASDNLQAAILAAINLCSRPDAAYWESCCLT